MATKVKKHSTDIFLDNLQKQLSDYDKQDIYEIIKKNVNKTITRKEIYKATKRYLKLIKKFFKDGGEKDGDENTDNYRNYWLEWKKILNVESKKLATLISMGIKTITVVRGTLSAMEIKKLKDLGYEIIEKSPENIANKGVVSKLPGGIMSKIPITLFTPVAITPPRFAKQLNQPYNDITLKGKIPRGLFNGSKPTKGVLNGYNEESIPINNEVPSKPIDKTISISGPDNGKSEIDVPLSLSEPDVSNTISISPRSDLPDNPEQSIPMPSYPDKDSPELLQGTPKTKNILINYDPRQEEKGEDLPDGFIDNINVQVNGTDIFGSCTVHYYSEEQKAKLTTEAQNMMENIMGKDSYVMREITRPVNAGGIAIGGPGGGD